MRSSTLFFSAALSAYSIVRASLIPSPGEVIEAADHLLHPDTEDYDALDFQEYVYDSKLGRYGNVCVLSALGDEKDDSHNLERAFKACGNNGIIHLPDANYTIGRPLDLELHNAYFNVNGWISFTTDTQYWIDHHIPFAFQNQALGFVIRGNDYVLDGNGRGGMDGNGQVWYDLAEDFGNMYGRPMTLAIVDSTNVLVKDWSIIQPQFWAAVTINSSHILFKNYYVNATSYNPSSYHDSKSWLQNTDGIDTYQSDDVMIDGMVYQGGDDCIALKANSTRITARNITCIGGTGIAFGSVAQYEGVQDIIQDVVMEDMYLASSSQCLGFNGVYFKSWVGESAGTPPNGGGGGHGYCRNVTVRNVHFEDIRHPILVQTDLIYLEDEQGKQRDNGKFEWSDIHLSSFTGRGALNSIVSIRCSKSKPCFGWTFNDIDVEPGREDHPEIGYVCNNLERSGMGGKLKKCHFSNSTLEMGDPKTK